MAARNALPARLAMMAMAMRRFTLNIVQKTKMISRHLKKKWRRKQIKTLLCTPAMTNRNMKRPFKHVQLLVFAVILALLLGFSSCSKCVKCTEKKGDAVVNDFPEVCGDEEMVKAYEADVQANKDPDKTMECIMR